MTVERRDVGPHDVLIEIAYCGICHSDIHFAREWVERLRDRLGDGESVPWFDPASGGVEARGLFLLEAPGQKSVGAEAGLRRTGTGIICVDNDDQTAQNCWTLRSEAGLPYRESLHWNIVPWYLGSADRIAAPGQTEIQTATQLATPPSPTLATAGSSTNIRTAHRPESDHSPSIQRLRRSLAPVASHAAVSGGSAGRAMRRRRLPAADDG
ncbi:hypothetical protein JCM4814A_09370 [Streptomyces phaeofaciens JCM 4814]|uniref:Uncharacterized protein n=1 Tax=Streptomyces phaeofaciens TaxID=68254 RepID=A0A918M278_9ACTN|nr:hypothetical protein GCM10010226_91580 [Streptomyces phaeofaciens]